MSFVTGKYMAVKSAVKNLGNKAVSSVNTVDSDIKTVLDEKVSGNGICNCAADLDNKNNIANLEARIKTLQTELNKKTGKVIVASTTQTFWQKWFGGNNANNTEVIANNTENTNNKNSILSWFTGNGSDDTVKESAKSTTNSVQSSAVGGYSWLEWILIFIVLFVVLGCVRYLWGAFQNNGGMK
jgi:hypothetical protein